MYSELLDQAQNDGIKRLNVAVALYNEDRKVLVCQRSSEKQYLPDIWHLPGGKVEDRESITEAIHREIIEELGVKIILKGYTGKRHDYTGHGGISARTEFFFGVIQENQEISLNSENQKTRWISSTEVKELFEPHVKELNEEIISQVESLS